MAEKRYRDKNGGDWLILSDESGNFFGTPDPGSARQYEPMPPDTDVVRAEGAAASLIEAYARSHASELRLVVTASASGGGALLLLLALGIAAWLERRHG